MKFSTATLAALSVFLPQIVSAHLVMDEPKQWFVPERIGATVETSDGQQSPLQGDGSNYPCHGVAPEDVVATYAPGSTQKLKLKGSAVHGGGSGQMSITYDLKPTKDSKFRVMQSWMGDHPVKAEGNLPPNPELDLDTINPLTFKVPTGLPKGKAVVAWTWYNRIGNREMYMKCATVEITGSETSTAAFEALPEMFRANSGNGCTVPEGIQAIAFKNPGPATVGKGITPIACDNTKPGTGGSGGSGESGESGESGKEPDTGDSNPSPTASPSSKPNPTVSPSSSTYPKPNPTASPSSKPKPNPNPNPNPNPSPTSVVVKPTGTGTSPPSYNPAPPSETTQTPAPSPPAQQSPAGGACVEGAVVCNGDGTWSQCGSGVLQNMGPVAAGMSCKNGTYVRQKRSIRFSHDHMRRRHAGAEVSQ